MADITYVDLPLENGRKFYYRDDKLHEIKDEIEEFLDGNDSMKTLNFAKKVMFSHELQSNNQVEGIHDDVELINDIIRRKIRKIEDAEKKKRILNLYRGYQFILKYKKANEESLRRLYKTLSNGLLIDYDLEHMGEFYREDIVYILSEFLDRDDADTGVDYQKVSELMKKYFAFYNEKRKDNLTEKYLLSQILHMYFVYIHPYFDVNGRTSRTMSMWYLLQNEAYPFIIFNRGIAFHRNDYYRAIKDAKESRDMTSFLSYMMEEVKLELEKEYIVQSIASNSSYHLESEDYQTLLYFMSIKGERTILDFSSLYNRLISKKKPKEVYEKMLLPLIDKDILKVERYCHKQLASNVPNMSLVINKENMELEQGKVKRLVI